MSPNQTPRRPVPVSACPWCGPGTELAMAYDKMGAVRLTCLKCECAGPKTEITGDFSGAEASAIANWSNRRQSAPIGRAVVERIKLAVGLHCLSGKLTPDAAISVAWSDLNVLLQATASDDLHLYPKE